MRFLLSDAVNYFYPIKKKKIYFIYLLKDKLTKII